MQQLLLDVKLTKQDKFAAEDFLPLSSSFQAHQVVLSSVANSLSGCLIIGPTGVGKTHLLNVAKQYLSVNVNADELLMLDDITQLDYVDEKIKYLLIDNIKQVTKEHQELLFHWFNHLKSANGKLILVAEKPLDELVELKDLKSRLLTLQQAIINYPSEKDLEIFILKQAFDRQIEIADDVLNYMLLRIERNFNKAEKLIDKIDEESLREKRKITIPFIKEYLN
jgi:DnaA family protein